MSRSAMTLLAVALSGGFVANAFAQDKPAASKFPPNYRTELAARLVLEYLTDNDGRPEIGSIQTNATGSSASVCLQYTMHKKFGPLTSDGKRHIVVVSEGRRFTRSDSFASCTGSMKPFAELEQAARLVRACGAKGEQRCTIAQVAGRRVVVTLPARMLSPKSE